MKKLKYNISNAELDEMIKHCFDVAETTSCKPCSIDHLKLASALTELKELRISL